MNEIEQSEGVLIGYAKLVEAVVYSATRPEMHISGISSERRLRNNYKFAFSKLLEHYCDVFNFPIEKVQKRIIQINDQYLHDETKHKVKIREAEKEGGGQAQTKNFKE